MQLKCPACTNTLKTILAGDIEVDICEGGCGGVWFDDREIRKFDEEHEVAAEKILNVRRGDGFQVKSGPVRYCPKCAEEELCRRFYDIKRHVTIEQCLRCSGIWLDPGELASIRGQYKTEAERNKDFDNYIAATLSDTKNAMEVGARERLEAWEEDVSFEGTVKALFRGLLGR